MQSSNSGKRSAKLEMQGFPFEQARPALTGLIAEHVDILLRCDQTGPKLYECRSTSDAPTAASKGAVAISDHRVPASTVRGAEAVFRPAQKTNVTHPRRGNSIWPSAAPTTHA